MKVCTDACLFGAWVAQKIESREISPNKILDIGSGTGLLSLMLAQKSDAIIDAVEIMENAFSQSKENIAKSPWLKRINIYNCDISDFTAEEKYDLIICNPPFYENDLKSPDAAKNTAMHSSNFSFANLASTIKNYLSEDGIAATLLPFSRADIFKQELIKQKLFTNEELHVANSSHSPVFRCILISGFKNDQNRINKMSVKGEDNKYSNAFIDLLKDYYLKL